MRGFSIPSEFSPKLERVEILIVEDDERMASLLKRGLEKEGHVATLTADGPEGLDFAMSRTFDLVILDVMLPLRYGPPRASRCFSLLVRCFFRRRVDPGLRRQNGRLRGSANESFGVNMNTLIPGAPLRSLSPTSIEYQRAQGASRAAKPARAARFTLDAPEHSGTIPGAMGDILPPGVALTSNLAVIFTLNQYTRS